MRTLRIDTLQFDRRETVGKMHREDRHRQDNDHRQADDRNESTHDHCEAADQFGKDCRPSQEPRKRHVKRCKNAREVFRSARELCPAVLHEAIADNDAQRQRPPRASTDWIKSRPPGKRVHPSTLPYLPTCIRSDALNVTSASHSTSALALMALHISCSMVIGRSRTRLRVA